MVSRLEIDSFLKCKTLAVVGVSRSPSKFGNTLFRELSKKGYRLIAVNPNMDFYEGMPCYPNLKAIPESVEGVVVVVSPDKSEAIVKESDALGISKIWLQQGSESDSALQFCMENNLSIVHGECILMFAEPAGAIHKIHRWIWGLFRKLPT